MPIDIELRELSKRAILAGYIRYGIVAALVVIGIPQSLLLGAAAELYVALALALSVLAYNTLSLLYLKKGSEDGKVVFAALLPILADAFVLTWLVHLSSGIVSPYVFFYLFPVVTAGMVFQRRHWAVYGTAAAVVIFYDGLLYLQYAGVIPLPPGFPWLSQLYANLPLVVTFGIMVPLAVLVLTVFVVQAGRLIQRKRSEVEIDLRSEIDSLRTQLEKKLEETNAELYRKNKALQESQALGRIGSWEYDLATQKIEWSDEVYELYGRDRKLGPPSEQEEATYYAPEQAKILREYARRAAEEGKEFSYDFTAKLPGGRTAHFSATMRPVKDEKGRIVKLFGTVQDISLRKRMEEARKESEQRFKVIFDNAIDGMLLADMENRKFFLGNAAICRMLGYGPEEIKGMGVMDIHPKEDLPYVIEQFQKQARKEITLAENLPVLRKDGSIFYADINSAPVELSGKQYMLGIFRDITERRRAEEEIDQRNRELKAINEVSLPTGSTLELKAVLDRALDKMLEVTGVETGSIYLMDSRKEKIDLVTYRGVSKRFADSVRSFKLGESLSGEAARSGEVIVVNDLHGDKRVATGLVSDEKICSMVSLPLKSKGKVLGVLNIASHKPHAFSAREVQFLTTFSNQIGAAVENAQLYASIRDELSERKRMGETILRGEEQFRLLFESSPVGIGVADMKGNLLAFNKAMLRPGGYSEEDIRKIGNVSSLYYDAKQREEAMDLFKKQGYLSNFSVKFKCKDGSPYDALLSLSKAFFKGQPCLQAIVQDVTERRRAEEEKEKLTKFMTGREERVVELKDEVNRILRELGRPEKYKT